MALLELPPRAAPARRVAAQFARRGGGEGSQLGQLRDLGRNTNGLPQRQRRRRVAAVGLVPGEPVRDELPVGREPGGGPQMRLRVQRAAVPLGRDRGDRSRDGPADRPSRHGEQSIRQLDQCPHPLGLLFGAQQLVDDRHEDLRIRHEVQRLPQRRGVVGVFGEQRERLHGLPSVRAEPVHHPAEPLDVQRAQPDRRVVRELATAPLQTGGLGQLRERRSRLGESGGVAIQQPSDDVLAAHGQPGLLDLDVVAATQRLDQVWRRLGLCGQGLQRHLAVLRRPHGDQASCGQVGEPARRPEPVVAVADQCDVPHTRLREPAERGEIGLEVEVALGLLGGAQPVGEDTAVDERGQVDDEIGRQHDQRAVGALVQLPVDGAQQRRGERIVDRQPDPVGQTLFQLVDRDDPRFPGERHVVRFYVGVCGQRQPVERLDVVLDGRSPRRRTPSGLPTPQ